MADNIRQIKSSFSTLNSATETRNNKAYLPSTALTKQYYSLGALELVSDSANAVSLLAGTANAIPSYLFSGTDVSANGLYNDITSLSEQVANQTEDYINSKVNRLKKLWNTKVDVTIQTLVGEVSAYALDLDNIGSNTLKKLTQIMSNITGTNLNSADSIGDVVSALGTDYFNALSADGSLKETINQLNSVKTVASALSTAVQIYKSIAMIKKIYEGLANTLSIASDFALSFWSGGTSAVKAVNTSAEVLQINITKLKTLALYTMKKFLFPIKVKIPALLVGDVDSLTVRSTMMGSSSVWGSLFDSEYYENVQYTQEWQNAIKKAITAVQTASATVTYVSGNYDRLFRNVMSDSYMSQITAKARKTAGLRDFPTDNIQKSYDGISSTRSTGAWQAIWGDKASLSPINSVESLIKVSGKVNEALI